MAITATLLAGATDQTFDGPFDTASFAVAADTVALFATAWARNSGTAPAPSISNLADGGEVWTSVGGFSYVEASTSAHIRLFRAVGPLAAGSRRINCSVNALACYHSVVEFAGVDTGGTNGADAIVQEVESGPSAGTSITVNLAALESADNVGYGLHGHLNGFGTTKGIADELHNLAASVMSMHTESELNQTVIDWTWPGAAFSGALAVELRAGAPPGPTFVPRTVVY